MRLIEFLTILCLPLLAGRDLTAQSKHDSLQKAYSENFGNIIDPMMSKGGSWLTIRKRDYVTVVRNITECKDTVLIFDLRNTENIRNLGTRQEVGEMSFVGNTHLLLSSSSQTELLDLKKQTSIYFDGVEKIQVLQNKKQFLLHYNKIENNRLELRDSCGGLLKTIYNVCLFYTTENGHTYSVTDDEKNDSAKIVFKTTQKIISLKVDPGEKGIIIHVQDPDNNSRDMLYLDLTTKDCFSLKDALSIPLQNAFSETIKEGSIYYLNLCINKERADDSLVDIWYMNDNKLEEKFYSPTSEVYYVWEPRNKKIQRIGDSILIKNANIGNERYFLSFDPYLLQDYIKPVSYKINVYDRLKDSYSLMDTISNGLHVSPDGQYVLYQKDERWYIYHIATGIKMAFGDNRLQTPYFSTDGKIVMFGGEGGLWRYDPEENKLSESDDFAGALLKIYNVSVNYIQGGVNFARNTFDADKPLILELFDSRKYKNTFLLWENGKSDTIIPSTGRYIQNLNYDDAYKHFSYMEEDYNLPPRIIYKTRGQRGKIIYQSNRADTAILSLKQEIISYTNSNGIPLTGTLYYPLHYNTSRKYPMVVHIYAGQHHLSNLYPFPSYNDELGFNIRLLLEKGYFVYLPDILIQGKKGPGLDALDCVNKSLDALAGNPLIDKNRVGLIGHSFGGYETDFIATHSTRFATYVSGSGASDIIWAYNSFNYNFLWPEYNRVESGQYDMRVPFLADKSLYFENNPVYSADKVNDPVLLWSGLEDKNVTSDHSMAFYNALRRNKKDVIALFYKGEGHGLQKPQAQFDLTCRILDWFDFYLKGDTGIEWISKGIKN
jgi:dipeptidyl aminopeptidase/acylaminoacyl peptidase